MDYTFFDADNHYYEAEEAFARYPSDRMARERCFRAFNRWLDDDWGFAHDERIFAAPYISLRDVDRAVAELEWVLGRARG